MKSKKVLIAYIGICTLLFVSMIVPFTLSAYIKDAESDGFYGEVSLRSYFERGTGRPKGTNGPSDPGDPYVITRPRHMYNLSRLQGLGVFKESTYFQLGLEGLAGDLTGKPLCYLDDTSTTTVPFLDMSDSDYDYEPINAIGSEAVPFYGEFDGQGLEIKNLTVYADPQDAGLFGYTAHGSSIHDLFLSNVTINSLGYTDSFAGLYGPSAPVAVGTSFVYDIEGSESDTFINTDTGKFKFLEFDAEDFFEWDESSGDPMPSIDYDVPVVSFTSTNTNYKYKFLISGDFLTYTDGNSEVSVDIEEVYRFFKKEKTEATTFPLRASSSVSLIASTTDNYGLDHSKVVMSLDFDFALNAKDSSILTMNAHLGSEHTNNIGLLIGHCDGSVSDCYVYNGRFEMNNGNTITGLSTYHAMENGSNYGLIGLIGGTVHNIAAEESDAATTTGKDIGVLDFTSVYNEIIDSHSFDTSTSLPGGGVSYTPSSSLKYRDFLRINGSGQHVTLERDSVSFRPQKIISNTDLGIFTIATNESGSGMDYEASNDLEKSVIRNEDVSVDSNYYIYYATGEYQKDKGPTFDKFRNALNSNTPSSFHPGYHFPNYDQITVESFEQRNWHQNYIVRFKMDYNYRTGKGFYFSDVDKNTVGGSFMSKYFESVLVDKDGHTIPASANSGKSGVMLRNSLGQEIRYFASSFATPDLSGTGMKMYCIDNDDYEKPVANMINFEIKTNTANVTIVAGLVDRTKPAAVGIYKIGDERDEYLGKPYVNRTFEDPDFAFFMPKDDHLAYFDYKVDNQNVGQIGVYNSDGSTFTPATIHTNATIPNTYGTTEYGYSSGKTRLYAHTFKLEPGRYCIGSASGVNRDSGKEGIAKLFYVCAQGQTDGQITFEDNAFASRDEVKNVDFVKKECYSYNPGTGVVTTNITLDKEHPVTVYNPSDSRVDNQRCYVALVNSDRSTFDAAPANVSFVYNQATNKFVISTDYISAVTYIAVSNYAHSHPVTGLSNATVTLFNEGDSTDDKIVYPEI